ncbi:DHA2 family efflux MFS transporter permease subunit [Ensifer sp. IC3342]|nr:DHA2 family efflux MFS transporter permease subunit [Ensifer sp. BRP08]MCA1451151.1 DHA2 family efflux MFS transporter permease subunit [Ensifer sp. IC3342]
MNRILPMILSVALFMEQMDSTVISTSLPAIAHDIGVGPITLKLALTSYMVALAIFIPLSGWMADRFGAKRIFRAAILVFIVGSVLCAISNSLIAFVLSRFLQGMGGAMMTPVARLVLIRGAPRSELVSAMALLTIPALVGPLAGPPLGGFITTYFSWHWIFLINVPVGIVGYVLSGIYLAEIGRRNSPPVDFLGFVLSGIAASGIVFGISVTNMAALPLAVGIASVSVGVAASLLYIFHARRHPAPVLELRLFRDGAFRAASIGSTIFCVSVGAISFLLLLLLQVGFGLNPFQSGLITFIGAVGAMTTKFLARRVLALAGFRKTLIVAAGLAAITTFANGFFTPAVPYLLMISILLIAGFARSFFFTSINVLAFADFDDADVSKAVSMSAVLQQIGLALGIALAAGILEIETSISGAPLSLDDFHIAFMLIAVANLLAAIPFLTMAENAGASVFGRRLQVCEAEATAGKSDPQSCAPARNF